MSLGSAITAAGIDGGEELAAKLTLAGFDTPAKLAVASERHLRKAGLSIYAALAVHRAFFGRSDAGVLAPAPAPVQESTDAIAPASAPDSPLYAPDSPAPAQDQAPKPSELKLEDVVVEDLGEGNRRFHVGRQHRAAVVDEFEHSLSCDDSEACGFSFCSILKNQAAHVKICGNPNGDCVQCVAQAKLDRAFVEKIRASGTKRAKTE